MGYLLSEIIFFLGPLTDNKGILYGCCQFVFVIVVFIMVIPRTLGHYNTWTSHHRSHLLYRAFSFFFHLAILVPRIIRTSFLHSSIAVVVVVVIVVAVVVVVVVVVVYNYVVFFNITDFYLS